MSEAQKENSVASKSFFQKIGSIFTSLGQILKASGDTIPEISPEELKKNIAKYELIDVRSKSEFYGELSHIPGAKLITLGNPLDEFLKTAQQDRPIVFICRSGARSASATAQSRSRGFTNTFNLRGGMLLWNQKGFSVEQY